MFGNFPLYHSEEELIQQKAKLNDNIDWTSEWKQRKTVVRFITLAAQNLKL
jgi:hypothetical protein